MAGPIANVTFDCANPASMATFWASALEYTLGESGDDYAAVNDPKGAGIGLFFLRVPESKAVKNRVHLDLDLGPREAAVARLVALGAREIKTYGEDGAWTVMADPEDNEFCVVKP